MGVYPSMLCATAQSALSVPPCHGCLPEHACATAHKEEDAAAQTACCLVWAAGFVPDPQRNELQPTLVDGWRLAVI